MDRNTTDNLIHALELSYDSHIMFVKPCICNVFRPRAHINVTTFTQFGQNWGNGCLLACMALLCIQLDYVVVSGQLFFFLSGLVCGPLD